MLVGAPVAPTSVPYVVGYNLPLRQYNVWAPWAALPIVTYYALALALWAVKFYVGPIALCGQYLAHTGRQSTVNGNAYLLPFFGCP